MASSTKRVAAYRICAALLLHLLGIVLRATTSEFAGLVSAMVQFVGFGIFVWGCFLYARTKGYSDTVGALGLLWIVGLAVLLLLPERANVKTNA